ncbi:hypothetical protein LINGRAHAP2_LOCUS30871 [Linum grandiflorum]
MEFYKKNWDMIKDQVMLAFGDFYLQSAMPNMVLMERMRGLMPTLVSRHQCAFVHGRQIMDASLIANELIDSRRRSGRPGLVIKLDIEKG